MGRVEMMARPRGPTSTTDRIDWREARYLARVVQLLVTSPTDKAEFKRELDYLVSAAEALRTGVAPPREPGFDRASQADSDDRTASEAEGAVLALWRANPSAVRDGTGEGHDQATAVDTLRVSRAEPDPVDEAELAQAVEEIERAAAALRVDEPSLTAAVEEIERAAAALRVDEPAPTAAVEGDGGPRHRPLQVWLQIAGLWISIAAATAGMVAGLILIMR
jgi:hypothetical protein